MALLLGDFIFENFEIPDVVNGLGGKQQLSKHKLLGGARVTDAMGPDDADPSWSGRFRGPDAVQRAQQLDAMRISGQEFDLSFGAIFCSVVIEEFEYNYMRVNEVPYRIKVYITAPIVPEIEPSLDDLVAADLLSFAGMVASFVDF